MIYIKNHRVYKTRNYLNIYKSFQLEFTDKIPLSLFHLDTCSYSYEFYPTEGNTGGTMIDLRNHLVYKGRNYLNIYKSFWLKFTLRFAILIGYIYKHPSINDLLDKLSKEKKTYFLLVTLTVTY